MRKPCKISILVLILTLILCFTAGVQAKKEPIQIYFFWGDGCPHCAQEEPFLKTQKEIYGGKIEIHDFELWNHPENVPLAQAFADAYGFEFGGVPMTFVGTEYVVGFSDEKLPVVQNMIAAAVENGAEDPMNVVNGITETEEPATSLQPNVIHVPFVGEVDLNEKGTLLTTIIIGLVDGVNPCSLWVLTMLLAMIVHTDSRKKTLLIGLVYLTVTALIYALFILGVFSVLSYISYMRWIQIAVACVTLVMGLINLKDYFFFKQGVSLTIKDTEKPGLYQKMRNVMRKSENVWAMLGATVALAAGVSLIEFSCTAAFPVIWSNILVAHNTSKLSFLLLLLLYMLLYQLDEMIIFGVAVITMKSKKMEEKHGQILKLFSGCLMVVLSVVLIVSPTLMNDLVNTLLVFGLAVLITLAVLLMTSVILPKFGIFAGHKRNKRKNGK